MTNNDQVENAEYLPIYYFISINSSIKRTAPGPLNVFPLQNMPVYWPDEEEPKQQQGPLEVTFSSKECEKELTIMLVLIYVVSFRGRSLLLRFRGSYCSQIYSVFILSINEHEDIREEDSESK